MESLRTLIRVSDLHEPPPVMHRYLLPRPITGTLNEYSAHYRPITGPLPAHYRPITGLLPAHYVGKGTLTGPLRGRMHSYRPITWEKALLPAITWEKALLLAHYWHSFLCPSSCLPPFHAAAHRPFPPLPAAAPRTG